MNIEKKQPQPVPPSLPRSPFGELTRRSNPENKEEYENLVKKISTMDERKAKDFLEEHGGEAALYVLFRNLKPETLFSFLKKISTGGVENLLEKMKGATTLKDQVKTIEEMLAQEEFRVIAKQDLESFLEVLVSAETEKLVRLAENVNAEQQLSLLKKIDEVIEKYSIDTPYLDRRENIIAAIRNKIQDIKKACATEKKVVKPKVSPVGKKEISFPQTIPPETGDDAGVFKIIISSKKEKELREKEKEVEKLVKNIKDEHGYDVRLLVSEKEKPNTTEEVEKRSREKAKIIADLKKLREIIEETNGVRTLKGGEETSGVKTIEAGGESERNKLLEAFGYKLAVSLDFVEKKIMESGGVDEKTRRRIKGVQETLCEEIKIKFLDYLARDRGETQNLVTPIQKHP